jgi:hypothetical protein
MKTQIKGLRKLETTEMEKVQGGVDYLALYCMALTISYMAAREALDYTAQQYFFDTYEAVC